MATLRVVVDQIVGRVPGGIGRYTEELTRHLIQTAPAGCDVEGIVAAHPQEKYDQVIQRLPGLAGLFTAPLGRRELSRAWQYGINIPVGSGMIHATSLFAPLKKHDRGHGGEQLAVTIHDVVPWTHPETLKPHGVAWHKAMAKRARKHADAIVVPTHAVADQLGDFLDFGDRIRVIGGAVSPSLALPPDADERAAALDLPERFVLSVGTLEPRKGIAALIQAMTRPELSAAETGDEADGIPLLIVGPDGWGDTDVATLAHDAGLPADRIRVLGFLSDRNLAVVLDRATVFAYPSLAEGFGLPMIEAFTFATPVVHSDDPALVEVAGGAGVIVERAEAAGYPKRLAEAIGSVLADAALADRLAVIGMDRARAFSWRDSAERVWQLHADL
ncbi:MAG: glycosyltransferase family 1 protein [Microbacteriaceae bacterium]